MKCRQTEIPILYYVTNRRKEFLYPLIKKHNLPGHTILSDTHASYVVLQSSVSNLAKLGLYHYWVNHSMSLRHE